MKAAAAASGLVLLALLMILPSRGRGVHRLVAASTVVERRRLLSVGGSDLARTARRRLGLLSAGVLVTVVLAESVGALAVVSAAALGVIVAVFFWQRAKHRQRSAAAALRALTRGRCARRVPVGS